MPAKLGIAHAICKYKASKNINKRKVMTPPRHQIFPPFIKTTHPSPPLFAQYRYACRKPHRM